MSTLLLLLASLLVCGLGPTILQDAQQQSPPPAAAPSNPPAAGTPAPSTAEAPIPADAANQINPVHPTPASQSRAKQIYGYDCAMCHGANGNGESELSGGKKLLDYRSAASLKSFTDGQLYYIILHGRGDMPGEEGRAKPDEIWNLVIYLRSFSNGKT
jgi:mono/diheme cytochrome c family protein